ncbi:hypothetical protein H5119_02125 [Pseudoalteromonas sp. SG45-5]|uniref:hypothetical protein n=1 Tax=unclassified Pseudoalteromonas TaxID=194690 RepID=UPI0015FBC0DB|nr:MULTISPECIES: hypothetical protein [unclassified Pseudoalteromonas]MBB1384357.1 hypothetical protein [Pseudoalteromonas sp. SG45-5]MBB1392355.1 hypothetical protein [Pseudoalteromonas sp. SG44-4]MBB1446830.1 hypothetical protein [Pseudoalteromonas sp. SG41-6]
MQISHSFNTQSREALNAACTQVNIIALNSYQTPSLITAAAGSTLLATAINDATRQQRPSAFNAVILSCSASSPAQLANKLAEFNQHCPLAVFTHAADHALSLSTLDTDKMRLPTIEQSIEWQQISNCCALPALANAFSDKSLALVNDEGANLITDIDTALALTAQLKAKRDQRLTNSLFLTCDNLTVTNSNAQSARGLAQQIETLGNNDKHWAYCVFVGSSENIKTIKELFA